VAPAEQSGQPVPEVTGVTLATVGGVRSTTTVTGRLSNSVVPTKAFATSACEPSASVVVSQVKPRVGGVTVPMKRASE